MAAISSSSSTSVGKNNYPHQKATPAILKECRDILGALVAKHMQEMAREQEAILKGYEQDKSLLNKGKWYPLDYLAALKANGGGEKRIEWFRENEYFVLGYVNHKVFNTLKIQGIPQQWQFIQKPGILPSTALKAAREGLAILDCGAMVQLSRYLAISDFLGSEKFDRLFKESLNIGYEDNNSQPMRFLVDFTQNALDSVYKGAHSEVGNRPIEVGQVVSINGPTSYKEKHPTGMAGNFNAICLNATPGQQTFIGHGLPAKGISEEKVCRLMIEGYNNDPDHFSRRPLKDSANKHLVAMTTEPHKEKKIAPSEWKTSVSGYDPTSPQDFRTELLYDLKEWPIEAVSMQAVSTYPKAPRPNISIQDLMKIMQGLKEK